MRWLQLSIRSLWLGATPAGFTPACHQTISSPLVHPFVWPSCCLVTSIHLGLALRPGRRSRHGWPPRSKRRSWRGCFAAAGPRRSLCVVMLDRPIVGLTGPRSASATLDVFFDLLHQLADNLGMLGLQVVRLARIPFKVIELYGRQSAF